MKRDNTTCGDGNDLACFRVAAGARRLVPDLEVAKARQLDFDTAGQRVADFLEESIDNILGFALVQTDTIEQQFGQLSLGQGTFRTHSISSLSALAHTV